MGCVTHDSRLGNMLPIVEPQRLEEKAGLWAPRAFGEFEEGDPETELYISGNAPNKKSCKEL